MLKLGVNIDHVATVREARYRGRNAGEPCPVAAALVCEAAGYDVIDHGFFPTFEIALPAAEMETAVAAPAAAKTPLAPVPQTTTAR